MKMFGKENEEIKDFTKRYGLFLLPSPKDRFSFRLPESRINGCPLAGLFLYGSCGVLGKTLYDDRKMAKSASKKSGRNEWL